MLNNEEEQPKQPGKIDPKAVEDAQAEPAANVGQANGNGGQRNANGFGKFYHLIPMWLALAMVGVYLLLSFFFVQCPLKCQELNGALLSDIDPKKKFNIAGANVNLKAKTNVSNSNSPATPSSSNTKTSTDTANTPPANAPENKNAVAANVKLANVVKQVDNLKTEADKLPGSGLIKGIDNLKKEVSEEPKETETAAAGNTATTPTPTVSSSKLALGNTAVSKEKTDPAEVLRESLQKRYSSRLTWVLLTALSIILLGVLVWFTAHVFIEALPTGKDKVSWTERGVFLVKTKSFSIPLAAVIVAFVVAVIFLFWGTEVTVYMPVAAAILKETVFDLEGIAGYWFGYSNGVFFAAIVFLVAASCAIFYKIRDLNNGPGSKLEKRSELKIELKELSAVGGAFAVSPAPDPHAERKADIRKTLQEIEVALRPYENWRMYSKGLLYIGGALLTVVLMRLNVLATWHRAFLTENSSTTMEAFFKSSLNNQAIFYTALLMAVYLPLVYSLPETSESPGIENSLNKRGFFATITTYFPQLIALISPLLATETFNLVKGAFTGQ